MEDLKYPKLNKLMPVIGPDQLLVKQIKGVNHIILKDYGIAIPVTSASKYSVGHSDTGKNSGVAVKINNQAPVNITNFDYSLTVKPTFREDTDRNKFNYGRFNSRIYSGKIPVLSVTGATIDDSSILQIESEILAQVLEDSQTNKDAEYIECRRAYIIKDDDNTDASGFDVNLADGTTVTFVTATTFAAGQLATQFNANASLNTHLMALRMSGDYVMIISKNTGYDFTIDTLVDVSVLRHELIFNSTNVEYPISVYSDDTMFQSQRPFFLISFDASDSNPSKLSLNINGTKQTLISATTQANVLAAINAMTGVFATSISTNIYLTSSYPLVLNTLDYNLNCDSDMAVGSYNICGRGSYPMLTADHLYKLFATITGWTEGEVRAQNTIAGTKYTKVLFYSDNTFPISGEASVFGTSTTRIAIIFPKSYTKGNAVWATGGGSSGTDINIVSLLSTLFSVDNFNAS